MKLTIVERRQVKEWIKICRIRGLSVAATTQMVNDQLPRPETKLAEQQIHRYIKQIKEEAKPWITQMAADSYEFIALIKERYDELDTVKAEAWRMLDAAKKNQNVGDQVKAGALLYKLNEKLLDITLQLPSVGIPRYDTNTTPQLPTYRAESEDPERIF